MITECPKCGQSDNGFVWKVAVQYTMVGLWGGEPEAMGAEERIPSRTWAKARCAECGHRVSLEVATGDVTWG